MDSNKNNWRLGETITLQREERRLMQSGLNSYEHYIGSRYICIREASEGQQGILLKVLGKTDSEQIRIVNGCPFCKDDHDELFESDRYFSYPFPSTKSVQEALEIIRNNQDLLHKFEKISMHLNPHSTFWVSDTTRKMLLLKKLQYYNSQDGQLYPAKDSNSHYRITFVYFSEGKLYW